MPRIHGSRDLWLAGLRADGPALQAALTEAAEGPQGLAVPVPSRPGWTVLDLVHHVGTEYRRVRGHVSRGVVSRPEEEPDEEPLPTGREAVTWWSEQFHRLLDLLAELDPEQPAWNFAPRPKQVAFWQRRMAHLTAVHRWDAQTAVGQVEPIEVKLATDGVSEVLDTLLPAGRRAGPADRAGVVRLVATDSGQEWVVRLRGQGIALLDTDSWLARDDQRTAATARGTASDLMLALYGRVRFDVLETAGDRTLLEALRTA